MSQINNISLNEDFWIQIKPTLVSFGFKWLPHGIHFTIVFDEKQEDMNLHITKNTRDQSNKPQIQILRVNRESFQKDVHHMTFLLFNKCLEVVDIEELIKMYSPEIYYISIDNIKGSSGIENKILNEFNDISELKRKKTRLKINGCIESKLKNIAHTEDMYKIITDNLIELSPNTQIINYSGMIITEQIQSQFLKWIMSVLPSKQI